MKQSKRPGPTVAFLTTLGVVFVWFAILWRTHELLDESIRRNTLELKNVPSMTSTGQRREELSVDGTASAASSSKSKVKFGVDLEQARTSPKAPNELAVSNFNSHSTKDEPPPRPKDSSNVDISCSNCTRYIVFRPIPHGQGTGQAMNGLLAAHLLGEEFNRVVCVTQKYEPFHVAFEAIHPQAVQDCLTLNLNPKPKLLTIINYNAAPDECKLKQELSSDKQIIYIVGNTYPRFRSVPYNYFSQFYKPTSTLESVFPWTVPPLTVVHLRKADREAVDPRAGLDSKTLQALGEVLPSDTFLVANNVNWFDYFEEKFHWKHPNWRGVQHSAWRDFLWGQRAELSDQDRSEQVQNLQMWSDWYSILCAKQVWHTHSDFSLSAIHWMNVESKTIMGVENGTLKLVDEPWRREELMPPLVDRKPHQLANCRKAPKSSVV